MPALPRPLSSAVTSQLGLARALWWAVRRREDVGPSDVPMPYNQLDRPVVWTIAGLGVVEIAVVHVLASWPPLRWSLFAAGVYGLLAFIAFDAAMRQHPHLLRARELVLRFGPFRSARIPLDCLVGVSKRVENAHRRNVTVDDGGAVFSFLGGTNVELRFSPPVPVTVAGVTHPVSRVAFLVADPAPAIARLRAADVRASQMLAPSGGGPSGSGAAKPPPDGGGLLMPTV